MIQQNIELGPVHEFLPGAMKMGLGLWGDEIESVDVEFGYLSKDLMSKSIGQSLVDAQLRLSRIEPESALMIDRLISECIEDGVGAEISSRAEWIRKVVVQVSDLSSGLKFLALMSKRMNLDSLTQVILRHREDLMDLIELLTGSRFGYDYVVPGGVRFDLSHGFSERLEKWIAVYQEDFSRIEAMFYWVPHHQAYLKQIGGVVDTGELGFVSEGFKEETRLGPVSSVKSRLDFVMSSTLSIGKELVVLLAEAHEGECKIKIDASLVKNSDVESALQTLRGEWRLRFKFKAGMIIQEMSVVTPSDETLKALPEALLQESIDDLPLILQSLNLSIAEIDK